MAAKTDVSSEGKKAILLNSLSPPVVICEPPKSSFSIFHALRIFNFVGTGEEALKEDKGQNQVASAENQVQILEVLPTLAETPEEVLSLQLTELEVTSASTKEDPEGDSDLCVECLDLGPLTPHYPSQPMPVLKNFPCLHPAAIEDLKTAESQAQETKAIIKELKTEIAYSSNMKKDMSEEEKEKLEKSKKNLERHVNEFEKLAEKILKVPMVQPSTGGHGETTTGAETVSEEIVKKVPEDNENIFCRGGEDHTTTLAVVESCSSEIILLESHRTKMRGELNQITAELESELAECGISLEGSTTRTARSAECEGLPEQEEQKMAGPEAEEGKASVLDTELSLRLQDGSSPRNQVAPISVGSLSYSSRGYDSVCLQELVTSMTDRLNESYQMQEHLASENKNLEEIRYELQEEILTKETETERMEQKLDALHQELRLLKKENRSLVEKLETKDKVAQPKNINKELSGITDKEINWLQREIKRLRTELSLLHTEREELVIKKLNVKNCLQQNERSNMSFQVSGNKNYQALQSDFEAALEEIRNLEGKNRYYKLQLERSMEENKELMEREREIERIKGEVARVEEISSQKDLQMNDLREQKSVATEEIEELRALLEDQGHEIQEYRNKYLQAQQRVEELSRELDYKQTEIETIRNDVSVEIRTVRTQFQEKLAGMDKMGAMLKEMQSKLQESQQQRLLMERALEEAKRELLHVLDTNNVLQKTLEGERNSRTVDISERQKLEAQIAEAEQKNNEMRNDNSEMQARLARLEEAAVYLEQRCAEKVKEASDMALALENARTDAARRLTRSKERADAVRRTLQVHVADLERELAAARASVKAAQRERDEVRHKLQAQITSLTETLEEGQTRWKGLQAHVTSLQNSLHPNAGHPQHHS